MKAIEDLKAALAAATPGEWVVKPGFSGVGNHVYSTTAVTNATDGDQWEPVVCVTDDDEPIAYEANAHLITLMHNTLPALIECAEALGHLVEHGEGYMFSGDEDKARAALAKLEQTK